MRNLLKSSALCLLVLVALAAASASAQTRDVRLVSARAGGINLVSGDVKAKRAGSPEWQSVSVNDDLKTGDTTRTGADGRVEVLLNPGSYLRAGASTEFELTDASLDNLRLNILRGSVLVEATGYDELGLNIQITTPRTRVELARSGVYRIDVAQTGETVIAVQKGRALVGDGTQLTVLKSGKVARAGAGGVEVAKIEKKQRDDLDLWSRERGRELAKVNVALASRQTNSLLASNGFWDLFNAEYPSSYLGLWIWSMQRGCYTFLPFNTGWRSPYGFGYGSYFVGYGNYNCWSCQTRPYQPIIVNNANPQETRTPNTTYIGGPSPSSGGGNSTGSTNFGGGGNRGGGTVASPPPASAPPVERGDRPARERSYEPGSRPIDQ